MTLKFDWDERKRKAVMSGDLFEDIRERFSVQNKAAKFARARGRYMPARTYVITPTGRFDIGLYYAIRMHLVENQFNAKLEHTEAFTKALSKPRLVDDDFKFSDLKYDLRDYQRQTVSLCLRNGCGTVELATGGGKTLIMASVLENILKQHPDFKCVVIVPDLGLVEQTFNGFKEYETTFSTSKWTGNDELDLGTNVVITNLGILQSDKSDTSWMNYVDVVLIDEVHKLRRGNKINKIINKIETPHKYGFTGTMPEDPLDQWNIIGKIGPIVYSKSSYELRKTKYISQVMIQMLELEYGSRPKGRTTSSPTEEYRNELDFITHSMWRNLILSTLCTNFDNNALLMVDYLEHGELLYKHLKKFCPRKKVYYIRGEVEVKDREKIKQLMEKRSDVIVVAISKIFSTGIDIKNLHYIIFASGGKAKIKTIQSVGRGLRLHKDKKKLIIFDIADKLKYGTQHSLKRKEFYRSENIAYGSQTIKETDEEASSEETSSQAKSSSEKSS